MPASGSSRRQQLDEDLAHLGPDALDLDAAGARRDPRAASDGSSTRSSATSARSRGSGARTRTRSSCARASRRSRRRRTLSGRGDRASRAALHEDLARALELREQGKGDSVGLPRPQPARRAVPAVRHADRARGLRGAHDLLLPELPDGRPAAEGSPALAAAALSGKGASLLRCPRAERRQARGGPAGFAARDRARAVARGRHRRAESGAHPPRKRFDGHGGGDRLHRRPRRGPEGRAHVALPGALRGGDRARRRPGGDARRGARGAHREQRRRAAGCAARRGAGFAPSGRSTAARR